MPTFEEFFGLFCLGMAILIALGPFLGYITKWADGWFWRLVWCLFFPVRFLFCVLFVPSLLFTLLISGVFHLAGHIAHNDGDYYDRTAIKVIGFWWVGDMWGFRSAMRRQE